MVTSSKLKIYQVCTYMCITFVFIIIDFIDCTRFCDFQDPCDTKTLLSGERRDVSCPYMQDNLCDDVISETWYKIEGSVVMSCPDKSSCGSRYPIWLNGTLPKTTDDAVIRTMCSRGLIGCCDFSYQIKIKLCPDFYAFCLPSVSRCSSRYCFNGNKCLGSTVSGNSSDITTAIYNDTVKGNDTEENKESTTVIDRNSKIRNGTDGMNDAVKIVVFGGIGILVVTITTVFIVCRTRRRKEEQTKSSKKCSLRDTTSLENKGQYDEINNLSSCSTLRKEENPTNISDNKRFTETTLSKNDGHYDEIKNVPNSLAKRPDEKSNLNDDMTDSQISPYSRAGDVDGAGITQLDGINIRLTNENDGKSNECVFNLKIENDTGQSTSMANKGLRDSMKYDELDLKCEYEGIKDLVNLSETQIINPYQTLQDNHQYEGMMGNHTYQSLGTEHQYAALKEGKEIVMS